MKITKEWMEATIESLLWWYTSLSLAPVYTRSFIPHTVSYSKCVGGALLLGWFSTYTCWFFFSFLKSTYKSWKNKRLEILSILRWLNVSLFIRQPETTTFFSFLFLFFPFHSFSAIECHHHPVVKLKWDTSNIHIKWIYTAIICS